MEDRIVEEIRERGLKINYGEMNIHTFHSYAMRYLGVDEVVSRNLLRHVIFRYFKDNSVFAYGDEYVQETIVPKVEEAIRYLKAYGITPDQVDEEALVAATGSYRSMTEAEMKAFARSFLGAFRRYEDVKGEMYDYSDLLLRFHRTADKQRFRHVLIDELQDVNRLEAMIALESGGEIFAVGDRKQAIFGFQGGSVGNFDLFGDAMKFTMEENFRSTNSILRYARQHYTAGTARKDHLDELSGLRNPGTGDGEKPRVITFGSGGIEDAVRTVLSRIPEDAGSIGIIARKNDTIAGIAKAFENDEGKSVVHNIGSDIARREIVWFILSLLSQDVYYVEKGMMGPFSPTPVGDILSFIKSAGNGVSLQSLMERYPEFSDLRKRAASLENIVDLLDELVLPACASRSREWFNTGISVREAFNELLNSHDEPDLDTIQSYLLVSGESEEIAEQEGKITLSTVHKAKGREFDVVIYLPASRRSNRLFVDSITEEILKQKGISTNEELQEESLRIDFVALTRARSLLYVVTRDDPEAYMNDEAVLEDVVPERSARNDDYARYRKAFVNLAAGNVEAAVRGLKTTDRWAMDLVKTHFSSLTRLSYSGIRESACEYLRQNILRLTDSKDAMERMNRGKNIHSYAEKVAMGQDVLVDDELVPVISNIKSIMKSLSGFTCSAVEHRMTIPIGDLVPGYDGLMFKGFIDAVFTDGNRYFIMDWKTDTRDSYSSEHDVQLEAYRRVYSIQNGIPLPNISAGVGYISLRGRVNLGILKPEIHYLTKPDKAYEKFVNKVDTVMKWRANPESFLKDLLEEKCDHVLCESVRTHYLQEINA